MILIHKMFFQAQNVAILKISITFIGVLNHISLVDNEKRPTIFLTKSINSGHNVILNSKNI